MDDPKVHEIDITKKYILLFDRKLSEVEVEKMRVNVEHWMNSDAPFLLIDERAKLVKVETDE